MPKNCFVDDCTKDSYIRGYCNAHYLRLQRTGSLTGTRRKTEQQRFWSKVEKTEGCWNWTAYVMPTGYGQFGRGGRAVLSHRFAYEATNGHIPAGMEVDHICFNRVCVNPEHLRLTTHKQNNEHKRGALSNNKSSGVRGVYAAGSKWQVKVGHQGKSHYIGIYESIAEAEAAAIAKRNEWFTHNDVDRAA